MIETTQPPQPLPGLTLKIVVPVLEEALAEAVAGMEVLPVTYMIPPPAVDLVMEAEISDRDPLQTDTKTHLMDDSLEVRGRTEVKQPLKGIVFYVLLIFAKRKEKKEIPCRRPTFRAVSRNFFFNVCCCDDAHGQVLAYKMYIMYKCQKWSFRRSYYSCVSHFSSLM